MPRGPGRGWTVYAEKRGRRWRCRWVGVRGSGAQTFLYRADADALAEAKRRDFERADAGLPPIAAAPAVATVGALADAYLLHAKSAKEENTVANFDAPSVASFRAFAGDALRLDAVTPHHAEVWKHRLAEGLGPTTVRMRYQQGAAMFNWAVRMDYLPRSPFARVPKPRATAEGRDLTEKEIRSLLAEAHPALYRCAVFALNTMLRIGEVVAFDWRWVVDELEGGDWLARVPGPARKRGKECWLVLNPAARAAMGPRREAGRVFEYQARRIQELLQEAREAAGLPDDVVFHGFRHTAASTYLRAGGHLEDLLKMGLWKDLRSVMRYVHVRPETVAPRFRAIKYSLPTPKSKKPGGPGRPRRLHDSA